MGERDNVGPSSRGRSGCDTASLSDARRHAKLLCRLALFVLLAGCAAGGRARYPGPVAGVRVVYEAGREIMGLGTLGTGEGEEVLVWEEPAPSQIPPSRAEEGEERTVRLLRLDVLSGRTKVVQDGVLDPGEPYSFQVGLSADGKRVATTGSDDPAEPGGGMYVSDDFRTWALVTPTDKRSRILPRWSPDGSALAFLSLDAEKFPELIPTEAVVISVPRPAKGGGTTTITPKGGRSIDVAWAADGRRLYHVVHLPARNEYYVEAVEWPSLERHTIMKGGPMGLLSVAGQTGEVVWLEEESKGKEAPAGHEWPGSVLWRLSPDGSLQKTPVGLDRAPFLAVVSPDGKRLAVLPKWRADRSRWWGMGLVVYSLADGTSRVYPELNEEWITSVAWVVGGRALVVAERGKKVWLVGMEVAP